MPPVVVSATYPASCGNPVVCNNPLTTTDAKGNVTEYSYDPVHGGILSVKGPAATAGGVRPEVRTAYSGLAAYYQASASSGPVPSAEIQYVPVAISTCRSTANCVGTADEIRTEIGYGPQVNGTANNLLPTTSSTRSGDGSLVATTTTTYDSIGNPVFVDGPLAGTADTTRTLYNAARQVSGTISPDPDGAGILKNRAQRFTFGADGQPTRVEVGTTMGQSDPAWAAFQPLKQVDLQYDATSGLKLREALSFGSTVYGVTQYGYDGNLLSCTAIRMNPANWNVAACGWWTSGPDGPDRVTLITRDIYGRPISTKTAAGTGDEATETRTFAGLSDKIATMTDGEGNLTTFEYDALGRLAKTRFPSASSPGVSSTTDYTQLTYDPNGNITQERLRDGQTIGFSYDNLNRKVSEDRSGNGIANQDLTYSYDLQGRLLTSSDAWGHIANYGYDALGRVVSETNTYGGTHLSQYDLAGRRTRLTWGDGFYVDYDRLVTGEVRAIRENGATSGVGVLGAYTYNDLGRRTSLTRGNGTVTSWGYDGAARLTSLSHDLAGTNYDVTTSFAYNSASQLSSSTRDNDGYAWTGHYNVDRAYTVNGLNQLTTAGATMLGYDARGNLTASGSVGYAYSQRNLLTSAPGVSLYYDPKGRLDLTHNGSNGTALSYDGDNLIAEFDNNSGALLRRYVHGPGTDEPLVWYEGAGTADRRWLHADERGSVVAVSNAAGAGTNVNTYDEYGIPGTGNVGRFQYTGQTWLPEIGMYYYKARMYSPTLGRFIQTDPIGYRDGMNWYAYAGGDPVNGADPSGTRGLKKSEVQNLKNIFGRAIDYENQSVFENYVADRSFVFWDTVSFASPFYQSDFSKVGFNTSTYREFLHEFYHQFEKAVGLTTQADLIMNQMAFAFGDNAYKWLSYSSFQYQNPEVRADVFSRCLTGDTVSCNRMDGFNYSAEFGNGNITISVRDGAFNVVYVYSESGSRIRIREEFSTEIRLTK